MDVILYINGLAYIPPGISRPDKISFDNVEAGHLLNPFNILLNIIVELVS